MKNIIFFMCLIIEILPGLARPAAAESSYDYVLPAESSRIFQEFIREPFPKPCHTTLQSTSISKDRVELFFQGPVNFKIHLVHPSGVKPRNRFGFFGLVDDVETCTEIKGLFGPLLKQRITDDPWILADEPDPAPSSPVESIGPYLAVFANIAMSGALALVLLLTAAGGLRSIWRLSRARAGADDRKDLLPVVIVSASALLPLYWMDSITINWYSIFSFDWDLISSSFPAWQSYTMLLATFLPPGISVFSAVIWTNQFCGIAIPILAYHLARKLEFSRLSSVVAGLVLASAPLFRQLGSSDSQHLSAMLLWMLAGYFLLGQRLDKRPGRIWLITALCILAILVRNESVAWCFTWLVFVRPSELKSLSRRTVIPAGIVLAAIISYIVWNNFDQLGPGRLYDYISIPFRFWNNLFTYPILAKVFNLISSIGFLLLLYIKPRKAAIVIGAILILASPVLFTCFTPNNQVTLRYFLPMIFFFSLPAAFAFEKLINLSAVLKIPLIVVSIILAGFAIFLESGIVYPAEHQFSFRNEAAFLRKINNHVPPGSVICMVDPKSHQFLEGDHEDFDTSFRPLEGQGRYWSIPVKFKLLKEETRLPGICDYYYESTVCQIDQKKLYCLKALREKGGEYREQSNKIGICENSDSLCCRMFKDIGWIRNYCKNIKLQNRLEPLVEEKAAASCLISESIFESDFVHFRLFKIDSESH